MKTRVDVGEADERTKGCWYVVAATWRFFELENASVVRASCCTSLFFLLASICLEVLTCVIQAMSADDTIVSSSSCTVGIRRESSVRSLLVNDPFSARSLSEKRSRHDAGTS